MKEESVGGRQRFFRFFHYLLDKMIRYCDRQMRGANGASESSKMVIVDRINSGVGEARILKSGIAQRVIFFYPGEEGTYIEHVFATLFDNGIIQLKTGAEETTTHLRNCEILWSFQAEEERTAKIRILKARNIERDPEKNLDPEKSPNP